MKMNHLSKETVETLMDKIHEVIASNDYSAETMEIWRTLRTSLPLG